MTGPSVRLRRSAVAVLACAAAPFLGVGAAEAAQITVVDATGDVRVYDGSGRPQVDPTVTNGDFARVNYDHRLHKVVLHAEYVDLRRPGSGEVLGFATRMRTNEQVYRVAYTFADGGAPRGEVFLEGRRRSVRCDVGHRIDYEANTITMGVPRSCISRPNWIRFTSAHFAFDGNTETFDHPHDDGPEPSAWSSRVYHD